MVQFLTTGMMNFRPLLFALTASTCLAEVLTLATEERFEGELLSISPEEGVLIKSARTPEPLALTLNSFSLLEMGGIVKEDPLQTERLVLANGDVLPGNLRSLDDKEIIYEGLAGGRLVLNRDKVTTLRFGIKPQVLQYEGPNPLTEWTGTGTEVWEASVAPEDSGILMVEPGTMEKDVNLGPQFIIKFNLKWQESPAVRIWFGSEPAEKEQQDRYYIDLNRGGVQIRRERSVEPRWQRLFSRNQLESYDDNQVSVELRVNRLIGTIDLYLDEVLAAQMTDPAPATTGNHIIVERSRSDNSASFLSNLNVYSCDAVSQIELMEEPGDGDVDSLVDGEGKRFSGELVGLFTPQAEVEPEDEVSPQDEEATEEPEKGPFEEAPAPAHFLLKSPYAEEPVEIPATRTRIIYFKDTLKNAAPSVFPKYELDLANDGIVSATSLAMKDGQITLEHPLLGSLSIARSAVKQIRYLKELTDEDE